MVKVWTTGRKKTGGLPRWEVIQERVTIPNGMPIINSGIFNDYKVKTNKQ
jgi:hypothetical protein